MMGVSEDAVISLGGCGWEDLIEREQRGPGLLGSQSLLHVLVESTEQFMAMVSPSGPAPSKASLIPAALGSSCFRVWLSSSWFCCAAWSRQEGCRGTGLSIHDVIRSSHWTCTELSLWAPHLKRREPCSASP